MYKTSSDDDRVRSMHAECFHPILENKQIDKDLVLCRHQVAQFTFPRGSGGGDELDILLTSPGGKEYRIPAFKNTAGGWTVRCPGAEPGEWTLSTIGDLDTFEERYRVEPYHGSHPLLAHGPVTVSDDKRSFCHSDGTPFFYFADTWWLGMSDRLRFPEEFAELTRNRLAHSFSVIRLTAGLNTDCGNFDPRNANEGGQPWTEDYGDINPAFWDAADARVEYLCSNGIVPAIICSWGFYLDFMGAPAMRKHLRQCIARWNAFPVIWYLAIEYDMPYYEEQHGEKDMDDARHRAEQWADMARYFKDMNPLGRPVSLQSWTTRHSVRNNFPDPSLIDFDSTQMGSRGMQTIPESVKVLGEMGEMRPTMPVLAADQCYEGLLEQNWQDIQRVAFWSSILSGSAGYTYGANGIWQFNRPDDPFGDSPQGTTWGGDTWEEAMNYRGVAQLGINVRFLQQYEFWKIRPHPEWIAGQPDRPYEPPYAGGIGDDLRFFYIPLHWHKRKLYNCQPDASYTAFWFDPCSGNESERFTMQADSDGEIEYPRAPGIWDFVLVAERQK